MKGSLRRRACGLRLSPKSIDSVKRRGKWRGARAARGQADTEDGRVTHANETERGTFAEEQT